MKAPSEEIYSKSTNYDFLLMANSKHVRITYRLRDILAFEFTLNSLLSYRIVLKITIFAHCIVIAGP